MNPKLFSGVLNKLIKGSKKRIGKSARMAGEVPRYIVGR